jgi:O-antigen/teichoic acid export membrane protein
MFGNLFNFLSGRVDRLILGPYLGVSAVGIYRMGVDIAELGSRQFAQPMGRVIYAGLATKGQDKAALKSAYLETQSVFIGVVLPMGLLTALCATEILRILAGPNWLAAAPVMWVLAPLIALNTLESGVRALIYINDAPEKMFFRNLLIFCVAMPIITAGVAWGGFEGVILASAVVKVFALVLTLMLAGKETNASFRAPFLKAWRSLLAGVCMVLTITVVVMWGPSTTANTTVPAAVMLLVVKCGLGLAAYLGMHFTLWALSGRPNGIETFGIAQVQKAKARLLRLVAL